MHHESAGRPRLLATVADPTAQPDPAVAERKNRLYAECVARAGGEPILLDARARPDQRAAAFREMDGLLLTGGADIDPARYGEAIQGSTGMEPERDTLEREAWDAAASRGLPVLGICRGFQAVNVFSGGRLVQHVAGHAGPGYGHGPALRHPLRLVPGSMLARVLVPTNSRGRVLEVNSYHHQAVRPGDLAPGLVASAFASSPEGDLVEALESSAGARLLLAVQCHAERTESTPREFERLWRFFVDACRG
ncbi:MAG TPA: gamma-glutamyl-gamma-aminobutyrate hydrolase family protein, partial [Candidatus Dormibacteraeota bacterium]|nr:gamma-glutamyl-gamma-aminobutyrate hydrolase family protein [Candidatus Dormibacteraeota bacterium]